MATRLRRNTSPEFVGIARLKAEQRRQLGDFERWASQNNWKQPPDSHYDSWMFPVSHPSGYGLKWTVHAGGIAKLKADNAYQRDHLRYNSGDLAVFFAEARDPYKAIVTL